MHGRRGGFGRGGGPPRGGIVISFGGGGLNVGWGGGGGGPGGGRGGRGGGGGGWGGGGGGWGGGRGGCGGGGGGNWGGWDRPNVGYWCYGDEGNNQGGGQPERPTGDGDAPQPDTNTTLTVQSVDLLVPANTKAHRTDRYNICDPRRRDKPLVVRRGQPFDIVIQFYKPYNDKTDDLRLNFSTGDMPLASKGTCVEIILSKEDTPKQWGAKILKQQGNTLTVTVFTPPDCIVSKWDFRLDVVKKDDNNVNVYRYQHKEPIYILFNPWCKDDLVYMEKENLLNEYILNETGRVYTGSKFSITAKPWNFAQFEESMLEVAMYILDASGLNWAVRGNPIMVVRKLSAMINSQDEGGVLVGNWSGNYAGGRSPMSWTGSAAILQEYWRTKKPVNFGQCWVFSAVTTTVCRALGIPTRSVTNYASAHDTDGSITIDVHYRPDGSVDEDLTHDSIWNFHVWNESWMSRPDLPTGYGGWQAFDATPQEVSDAVYCCGPVSVAAIKLGEVNLPYDAGFVFAEVNADRAFWKRSVTGTFECTGIDKATVGAFISTKAPNSNDREDITECYKHPEGSAGERAAVLKAHQVGSNRKPVYKLDNVDMEFTYQHDAENTWMGKNFDVALTMTNKGNDQRTVFWKATVSSMFYTGTIGDVIQIAPGNQQDALVVLKPKEKKKVTITVTENEYRDKLKDGCMLDMSVWAEVKETSQVHTSKESYRLKKPHITIKAPNEVVLGKQFEVQLSFANPLNTLLTRCTLDVDGIAQILRLPQQNVGAKGTFQTTLPVVPSKLGQHELIVTFDSQELADVNGSQPIFVKGQ